MEGLNNKEKGLMDMDDSVVIAGGGYIRGLQGNRKNKRLKNNKSLNEDFCLKWNIRMNIA